MSSAELLARVRAALRAADVPHVLTGSFASSIHGVPRSTQDIDIVIAPTPAQLEALLAQFPDDEFHRNAEGARLALALDRAYVDRWVRALGLEVEWRQVENAARG